MKEFDCKVSSTWSVCGKVGAEAFTHRHLSPEKKHKFAAGLHYIIGPMRRNDEIYIHNARRKWATWDHHPIFAWTQEEPHIKVFQKSDKKWTGWRPTTEDQLMHFKKKVMKKGGDKEENLSTENALKKVQHRTNAQKEKEMMRTPENVRLREETVARCTAKITRIVLRRQARKARAEHLVRCSLEPGKKKTKRKPLTELYVKGHFTEDRAEWQEELQRQCEKVYNNMEETKEVREKRIEYFRKKVNQQFTRKDASQRSPLTWFCKPEPNKDRKKVNEPEDASWSKGCPWRRFTL